MVAIPVQSSKAVPENRQIWIQAYEKAKSKLPHSLSDTAHRSPPQIILTPVQQTLKITNNDKSVKIKFLIKLNAFRI